MKLTNRWNRFVYHLWSPIYDGLFDRFFAAPGRRRAMQVLALRSGERVLRVGVGAGADLPLLPARACAVGLDLSPDMLVKAQVRLPLAGRDVTLFMVLQAVILFLGAGRRPDSAIRQLARA